MSLGSTLVIGVTPAFDEGCKLPQSKASFYLRREYTKLLAELGAMPLILTPDMHLDAIVELCDGIVISGGEDIPAEVYGGEQLLTVPEPLERIMWERLLIDRFQSEKLPILGVCYGMQLLALHFGGSLFQDIPTNIPESIDHRGTMHSVEIKRDFLGLQAGSVQTVASRHHQAVASIPDTFELTATAPDGVIEGMANHRIFGVQWHPESDTTGRTLYRAFIDACTEARQP